MIRRLIAAIAEPLSWEARLFGMCLVVWVVYALLLLGFQL